MTQEQNELIQQQPIRVLEAMLFASATPLSIHALRSRLPENADVGGMLMELKATYEARGVNLVEMEGNWAFRTATDVGEALQVTREVQRKLSRAAMDTLAIIAYHQPVTRAEIENIRGVMTHKGTLDVLMEMGWIKPGRRRETPGRPVTWVTTAAFMDHFGLESLNDLPGLDELKASGLLDRRPAIDALQTGSLFGEDGDFENDLAGDEESDEDYEDENSDEEFDDEDSGDEITAAAKSGDDEDEDEELEDSGDESDEDEDEDEDEDFDDEDEDDEEDED